MVTPGIVEVSLWLLMGFSATTWALILAKSWAFWRAGRANRGYIRLFNASIKAGAMPPIPAGSDSPFGRLASVGFGVLRELPDRMDPKEAGKLRRTLLEGALLRQIAKERSRLERGLTVFASVGSVSPFVGLFGTVWGIMGALWDIGQAQSASQDVVAGPIGEALIATAIGIGAAVPAVLAYNFFLRRLRLYETKLEGFATQFFVWAPRLGARWAPSLEPPVQTSDCIDV